MILRPKPWNEIDVTTEVTDSTEILINNNGIKRISVENFNNNIESNITNNVLISVSGSFVPSSGNIVIPSGYGLYMIDTDVEGAWRTTVDNGNLLDQRYESGQWITKQSVIKDSRYVFVPPSNDTSGETDFNNITEALTVSNIRAIVLDGTYYVNNTLIFNSCSLIGLTRSSITYTGTATSSYLIKMIGGTDVGIIKDIGLSCANNCRGLQIYHTVYRKILDNVRVYAATEIACDLIDCWGSDLDGLAITASRGIALRMHRCNSFIAENVRLGSHKCFRSSDSSEDTALAIYASTNGVVAAAALYDGTGGYGTYTEDWPAVDDESVVDSDSSTSYVQTVEADRAPIVITNSTDQQDLTIFDNLTIEGFTCADYPSIISFANTIEMRNVRWEGGYHRNSLIQVTGNGGTHGTHITLDNARILAINKPSTIFELFGSTKFVTLRNVLASTYVTTNFVVCNGGTHQDVIIENCRVPGEIADSNIVSLINGATLTGKRRVWGDIHTQSNSAIYFGDSTLDGSWRIARSGDNLINQRYENASWVTKNTVLSSGDISYVYASYDQTGVTDYTNIQNAISRQTIGANSRTQGRVELVGEHFYVNQGIIIGNSGDNSVRSCNISAPSQAYIKYVGDTTSNYLLSVYGVTYSPTDRVSNLYLDCDNKCRGLLFHRQVYLATVRDTMVYNAREIGVDWATSYKARADNLHILSTDGISLRVWHSQGSEFNNLRIASNAVTTWPSPTDITVHDDYTDNWIRTAENQQAAIMLRSQDLVFRNLLLENNNFIGSNKPFIYIYGGGSLNIHFLDQIYIETSDFDYNFCTIDGDTNNTNTYGKNFTFQNIDIHDTNNMKTFIKAVGYLNNVVVDGIISPIAQSGDLSIITCFGSSSHLYSSKVINSSIDIVSSGLIVSVSGGIIESDLVSGNDFQSIEKNVGLIKFDSDYNIPKIQAKSRWDYMNRDFIAELEAEEWWTARRGLKVANGENIVGTWKSIGSNQTEIQAYNNPTFNTNVINKMPFVTLTGGNYFSANVPLFSGIRGGCIFISHKPTSATEMLLSQNDTATGNKFIQFGFLSSDRSYYQQIYADTADALYSNTTTASSGLFCTAFYSSGSGVKMWINGTQQNVQVSSGANNGDWWGDTADCDNTIIGGNIRNAGFTNAFTGNIAEIIVVDHAVDEDIFLKASDQLMSIYGI